MNLDPREIARYLGIRGKALDPQGTAWADQCQGELAQAVTPRHLGRRLPLTLFQGQSRDWDLGAQPLVLDLLQAPKRLGLTLTAGGMLVPEKSVTALVGISDRKEEACGQKCMRCTKTDCPFRAGPAEVLREP